MSNEIKVTASLHEEDRKRIDELIRALHDLTGGNCGPHATTGGYQNAPQTDAAEPVKEQSQPAEKASENEQDAPAPWAKDAPDLPGVAAEAPAAGYSKEDVQQKVVSLAAAGKKAEVKEIVNEYAERVSLIPEDKLDEVMSRLITLEG